MNFFCIFAVMKEKEELRQSLKANPRLKKWLDYVIMNQRDARPRSSFLPTSGTRFKDLFKC